MAYALLIVETPGGREARSEAQGREQYDRMLHFSQDLKVRGLLTVSQSLTSERNGARVQSRGGETTVVDGPFSEAREMVGGFFLLTCDSRDQAIAIARQCPATGWATVEVRELGPCIA